MTPKALKRLGVTGGVCLVSAVLAVVLLYSGSPSYGGKPLRFWFERLPMVQEGYAGSVRGNSVSVSYRVARPSWVPRPGDKDAREALKAVRAMGTNALPFLIRKLKRPAPSTAFGRMAQRYGGKVPIVKELFPDNHRMFVEQEQAVAGLFALCPLPPDTVLELRKLSLEFNGTAWGQAGDVLRANENPKIVRAALEPYE